MVILGLDGSPLVYLDEYIRRKAEEEGFDAETAVQTAREIIEDARRSEL